MTSDELAKLHQDEMYQQANEWLHSRPLGPVPVIGDECMMLPFEADGRAVYAIENAGLISVVVGPNGRATMRISILGASGSRRAHQAKAYLTWLMADILSMECTTTVDRTTSGTN